MGRVSRCVFGVGSSLVAFFVLEAVIGLLNSFMLAGSIDFKRELCGCGHCGRNRRVLLHRVQLRIIPKVSTVSRVVMPVLAAMLVFLPFLSERYNLVFSMLLLGSCSFRRAAHHLSYRRGGTDAQGIALRADRAWPWASRVCLAVTLLSGYAAGVAGSPATRPSIRCAVS